MCDGGHREITGMCYEEGHIHSFVCESHAERARFYETETTG